jgi:hypothetical protein
MRRLCFVISVVVLVSLFIGCNEDTRPVVTYTEPVDDSVVEVEAEVAVPSGPSVSATPDSGSVTTVSTFQPPDDMVWISPAKVNISNLYAGARAEWEITLHNGNDYKTRFKVVYRIPDDAAKGYNKATVDEEQWVTVSDPMPVLEPRETRKILVVIDVPLRAKVINKNWEFWISVMDDQQQGQVITELCSRWQVSMR